jgi:hypothetical protein
MSQDDIIRIIEIIKRYFPKDATEISDALDLLNLALDGLMSSANKSIAEFHKNKEFDKGMELWEFSKQCQQFRRQSMSIHLCST